MFNFLKKKETNKPIDARDLLFGDLPLSEWPKDPTLTMEPWVSFIQARQHVESRQNTQAIAALQKITEMPGLESRHYLQAWHFLRSLGVNPPADKAKTVYGVVVEVGMEKGADLLAAYLDHTARYLNYSGSGVIWEHPDDSLDVEMDALLKAGQDVANKIGPWEEPRPPAPTNGNVRLNMLTPSGLHFGYGGFDVLNNEPMGRALISPATQLMQKLTSKNLPRK